MKRDTKSDIFESFEDCLNNLCSRQPTKCEAKPLFCYRGKHNKEKKCVFMGKCKSFVYKVRR